MITPSFNWNSIPRYTLNINELADPYDICRFMSKRKIDKYLYRIKYKGIVLKFGMSSDNSKNYGERLYRQIGHDQTWPKPLNGPSGADWLIIERDFSKKYGIQVTKDHLEVEVWDLTNYEFKSLTPRDEILRLESELISMYVSIVGEKPIGNIYDDESVFRRGMISVSLFERYFEL